MKRYLSLTILFFSFFIVSAFSQTSIWSWGFNSQGIQGTGNQISTSTPTQRSLDNVIAAMGGQYHSAFIRTDGSLWVCGANYDGQLGNGSYNSSINLYQVQGITNAVYVTPGCCDTAVLCANGNVYSWGDNSYGQLGNGTINNSTLPVQVTIPHKSHVKSLTLDSGGSFTLALMSDGTIYSWGKNDYGQLGLGYVSSGSHPGVYIPTLIPSLTNVVGIAVGSNHCLAVTKDGHVYSWGYNLYGQLGRSGINFSPTPTIVNGIPSSIAVACGGYHSVVLSADNHVYAWGYNTYGQLGRGTFTTGVNPDPVLVSGISNVSAIAAGMFHTTVITTSRQVYSWGYNMYGELGTGSTTTNSPYGSAAPVPAINLSGVAAINAGSQFDFALVSPDILVPCRVTLNGWVGTNMPPITAAVDSNPPQSVTFSGTTFTVPVPPGSHSLSISVKGFLTERVPLLVFNGMPQVNFMGPNATGLIAGDTNNDNYIDDTDLLNVINHFLESGPFGDVNGDGIVDDTDILLVINNFLSTGDI